MLKRKTYVFVYCTMLCKYSQLKNMQK